MTSRRIIGTTVVAFIVSQALAIVVHGFILAADYAPFYGTLLRPMPAEGEWRMLLLPLVHLCFVSGLVWVYSRIRIEGSAAAQGLKLGFVGWVVGQLPLWLLWNAEQPWPGSLVVKQLVLELVSALIVGVTIALPARRSVAEPIWSAAG